MLCVLFATLLCLYVSGYRQREFVSVRFPAMEGLMPPIRPISGVSDKMTCAFMCVEDDTCTSFSHSPVNQFCQLSEEVMRPKDMNISNKISHYYHFDVFEVIENGTVKLKQGYRWYPDLGVAVRFHYYWPKTSEDAQKVCETENAQLVTIDSTNKTQLLQTIISTNNKLSIISQPFLVNMTNSTEQLESVEGTGDCLALNPLGLNTTFTAADCEVEHPFICEWVWPVLNTSSLNSAPGVLGPRRNFGVFYSTAVDNTV